MVNDGLHKAQSTDALSLTIVKKLWKICVCHLQNYYESSAMLGLAVRRGKKSGVAQRIRVEQFIPTAMDTPSILLPVMQ